MKLSPSFQFLAQAIWKILILALLEELLLISKLVLDTLLLHIQWLFDSRGDIDYATWLQCLTCSYTSYNRVDLAFSEIVISQLIKDSISKLRLLVF